MNKNVILNYINKINKTDIINYAQKQGIIINNNDVDIIYYYIKNKYNDFLNNPQDILNEIQDNISNNIYLKLLELYEKYKIFIDKIK